MEEREFRIIPDFENYQISNDGIVQNVKTGRCLSYETDKDGYFRVQLCKNNKKFKRFVHRLVAQTFIENPESLPIVDHIDRDKQNNHVSNLRWTSHSGNSRNLDSNRKVRLTNIDGTFIDFETAIAAAEYLNVKPAMLNGALNINSKLKYVATYID